MCTAGVKEPSQGGGKLTLTDLDEPVDMQRYSPRSPFTSAQDLRRSKESIAKIETPFHPVERQLACLDSSTPSLVVSSSFADSFYGPCIQREHAKRANTVPVRPIPNHAVSSAANDLLKNLNFTAVMPASERRSLDMAALLEQQLGNKGPRSSQFLTSIAATVEEAVEERRSGSGTSRGLSSDFDEEEEEAAPFQGQVSEHLKGVITEHPLYPTLVLAHIRILKVGAPSGLQARRIPQTWTKA